ncbi:formylglycine-generating enzyme family protein [Candidatus Fermentibacteria bacterium]|nr:formylglycine-generating enzyme family protein [Candidatus Fermentibacteria bacterium]
MMMWIPPGSFTAAMPWDDPRGGEEPYRTVALRGFWIGKYEVTQTQYETVMGTNPSRFVGCGGQCPVEQVSWFDAAAFCNRLSELEGLQPCYHEENWALDRLANGYRLPTEAEWEYACRAGTNTALYSGGMTIVSPNHSPELGRIAWYGGNSCVTYEGGEECAAWLGRQEQCARCGTLPVGGREPNAWGLHDTLGNVWEWCHDWLGPLAAGSFADPMGADTGTVRVDRGGAWRYQAAKCRPDFRDGRLPGYRGSEMGFRIVRGTL